MRLREVTAPMMVCTQDGEIVEMSTAAADVLSRFGIDAEASGLPRGLRRLLELCPLGQSCEWYPIGRGAPSACLGLTCYKDGEARRLVIMREPTTVRRALAQRLYDQRISALGHLARGLAHDFRSALASVVRSTRLLGAHVDVLAPPMRDRVDGAVGDIASATARMNNLLDALLDGTRVDSPEHVQVELGEIFDRIAGLMGPRLEDGGHRLETSLGVAASRARGNPLLLEEALALVVEHALDASAEATSRVAVRSRRHGNEVCVTVSFDGGGSASAGDWMALPMAREAVSLTGGRMTVEIGSANPRVELWLPAVPLKEVA